MRPFTVLILALLALAKPAAATHPGARPGEAFTFRFWLGAIEGGRARMSIGKPMSRQGRRVITVHGAAETTAFIKLLAHVQDDYKLVVDTQNLLPLSVAQTERGMRERRVTSTMDGRTADVDYWAPDQKNWGRHVLTKVARDPLSGFFALRALPLDDGQQISLDVLEGHALWRVALVARRGQTVRLDGDAPGGPAHAAIRLDGVATYIEDNGHPRGTTARDMTIFISDDAYRVLLRMEGDTDLGRCSLELTSYRPALGVAEERAPQLPGIETR